MPSALRRTFATVALCAAILLTVGAASGVAGSPPAALQDSAAAAAGATPTQSSTPPGPVDPGTGESPEAKETRVDYTPYIVAAVLVLALGAAFIVWRRVGGPSSKTARHSGDQAQNQGEPRDRGPGE